MMIRQGLVVRKRRFLKMKAEKSKVKLLGRKGGLVWEVIMGESNRRMFWSFGG